MITIANATYEDLAYVASWLSAVDRMELALTRDPDDYRSLARDAAASSVCKVALDGGLVPIFAFGLYPVGKSALQVWGFKTERGPRAILSITKYLLKDLMPAMRIAGYTRAACRVHRDNLQSRRWLAHLGFVPEATPGETGTPLILYQLDEHVIH